MSKTDGRIWNSAGTDMELPVQYFLRCICFNIYCLRNQFSEKYITKALKTPIPYIDVDINCDTFWDDQIDDKHCQSQPQGDRGRRTEVLNKL